MDAKEHHRVYMRKRSLEKRKEDLTWLEKHRKYQREWARKNRLDPAKREKERVRYVKYRLSGKITSEYRMLTSAKLRAKKLGIPFDIELSDIVIPDICPLLGIPVVEGHMKGKRGPSRTSPSLDRIRPELGYVKGNVWVISHRANLLKRDASPDELERIAARLREELALRVKVA